MENVLQALIFRFLFMLPRIASIFLVAWVLSV